MLDKLIIAKFICMTGITPLVISKVISETEDFKTFVFEEGHSVKYEAGQFLTLVHNTGVSEIRRSYSIISSPALQEPLAIGIKRIDNGYFSRLLIDRVDQGQMLYTSGAAGFFKLPANTDDFEKVVFFAAGSGITPVLSMIKTILYAHPLLHIMLVYSNRSKRSAVYYEKLQRLQDEFPQRLTIHFLFSSSPDLLRARLNRDLFFEYMYGENIDIEKTLFYTCGPLPYMRMIIFLLEEFGVPLNKIRKEDFVPSPEGARINVPPDTGSYFATIHFNSATYKFMVSYPDTILRAAKKEKIMLPYSCENGRCGNCAAKRLQGKVWLTTNEVLTEEDIANGLTLTCTGHPVHGDVELAIV